MLMLERLNESARKLYEPEKARFPVILTFSVFTVSLLTFIST